jgi:hypothetical protein
VTLAKGVKASNKRVSAPLAFEKNHGERRWIFFGIVRFMLSHGRAGDSGLTIRTIH